MTYDEYEAQIIALAEVAEPLRVVRDDDPRANQLSRLVDQINALRDLQSRVRDVIDAKVVEHHELDLATTLESLAPQKRGPGRPRKHPLPEATIEGSDAK